MRITYAARRVAQILPMVLTVAVLNFFLVHLTPGDPASALAGENAPQSYIDELRRSYGLDAPMSTQLLHYLGKLAQGDLGYSFSYQQPVLSMILSRLPATILLVVASQAIAIVAGTLLGALAARHYGRWPDRIISFGSLTLYSVPVFWSGMVLILVFAVTLRALPSSGMSSYGADGITPVDLLRHLVLPVTVLALNNLPVYARLTRSALLEVMNEDFVTTSRAIGYPHRRIFFRHALRNALLPTVTQAGVSMGFVFAGALLTETVFGWPGMGQLMYNAVFQRDYPLLMGIFILTAVCVAVAGLITDVIYSLVDPRVRYE